MQVRTIFWVFVQMVQHLYDTVSVSDRPGPLVPHDGRACAL